MSILFIQRKKSGPCTSEAGQAMVELAIVLPVLLLLVCGIIEFGRAMYIKNTLTSSARAAVRVAIVTSGYVNHTYSAGELATRSDTDTVQQKVYDCLNSVDKNTASATVISEHSPAQVNDTVTAAVSVPFTTIVPGVLKMFRDSNNNPITLVGTASMRYE